MCVCVCVYNCVQFILFLPPPDLLDLKTKKQRNTFWGEYFENYFDVFGLFTN